MEPPVLRSLEDGVLTLTLNRPEQLNTTTPELVELLVGHLSVAQEDEAVRCVVLTGAGRAFCAGGDLQAGAAGLADENLTNAGMAGDLRRAAQASELLRDMPKPTVAAINGACAGAGLSLALACDVRVAAARAKFNTAFLTVGLSGDFGAAYLLARAVGPARARELMLMPGKFDAERAHALGLVTAVAADADDLEGRVSELAGRLARSAPLAVAGIKANLRDALELPFAAYLDREAERHVACARSADALEAGLAFLQKREPAFTGR